MLNDMTNDHDDDPDWLKPMRDKLKDVAGGQVPTDTPGPARARAKAAWSKPDVVEEPPTEVWMDADEDERRTYRASSIGGCITALAAVAQGIEPAEMPESLQPALQAGIDNEPAILALLKEECGVRAATYIELAALKEEGVIAGYNPEQGQVQVRLKVGKGAMVTAHPDLIGVSVIFNGSKFCVVEAKAFGEGYWADWQRDGLNAFPGYQWQVSAQMHCTGLPGLFVVGHKSAATGLVDEIEVLELVEAPIPLAQFKMKVMRADKYAAKGEVPDCTEPRWPCPVYFLPQHPDKPETQEVVDAELGSLCARHHAYHADEKEAKAERDKIKVQIEKHLAEKGYAKGQKVKVESPAGEMYEFEWVEREMPERTMKAGTMAYPSVKLLDA